MRKGLKSAHTPIFAGRVSLFLNAPRAGEGRVSQAMAGGLKKQRNPLKKMGLFQDGLYRWALFPRKTGLLLGISGFFFDLNFINC